MARDLSDAFAWIRDLITRVQLLEGGSMLENSSITDGRMRFIRGLLRLDSGARLEGVGTFSWTGPGSIAGDWEVLEGGVIKVGGVLISPVGGGRIMVGAGPVGIILDGGLGRITMGDVRIEEGKIFVGGLVLDPASHSGYIKLPNGSEVLGAGDNVELYSAGGVKNGLVVTPTGIKVSAVREATSLTGLEWLAYSPTTGDVFRVAPGTGGPEGGHLEWPFPSSTVTSEFGPRDSPGPGGSEYHLGIDFGQPEGTPIPSAGAGTVLATGYSPTGYGNWLTIDHGGGIVTLYAHMVAPPVVATGETITAGQIVGHVGNTGASFGAHLHLEVRVDGSPVNPRSKLRAA